MGLLGLCTGSSGISFSFSFLSSGDVACMAICSRQCPAAMAFCFLEALWWDFIASYDTTCIGLASRPYTFLEFGLYLSSTFFLLSYGVLRVEFEV